MVVITTKKSIYEKKREVIQRFINENGKETNWDTLEKVIEEYSYDTSPVEMEECVHNENNDEKETENEYEGVIQIYITQNEHETNQHTFDKVIEVCPYDTTPVEMEEGINNEEYHEKEKRQRMKMKV